MRDEQRAQVVDAVNMVRMFMSIEHRVEVIDAGIEQLFAQVRRGIDQHAGLAAVRGRAIDQDRAPPPSVLGITGIASAPPGPRPRHAAGKAASQNGDRKHHAAAAEMCGTLLKRRKKFSVVWRAIWSNETPRTLASTFAVSVT